MAEPSKRKIPPASAHLPLAEQQKLQEKLLTTEARLNLAFTYAPIGMVLLTPDGRITEVNEAFQKMLGYTQQELTAADSAAFTHRDDIAPTKEFFAALFQGPHNTGTIEKRYFRKSGEMFWARASAALQRDEEGRASHVIATVEDITERKQAEMRYRFLAESIPQMVWTATPDGQLDYVNGQGARYFETSPEALLGSGWLIWVHPDDQARTIAAWKSSLETGRPYETEFRLKRAKDGDWRSHLVRATPLTGEKGEITQWFGTCTDIENQRRADFVLRQQWHTFDTVLSHSPDFAYIFDRQGRFTYVNRSLLALWQKSLPEACGKTFAELDYPPDLAARLQSQIEQVVETQQPLRDQTPYTGPTGETRHYDYIFVPIFDAKGQVEAVAGSTRDITEQHEVRQQIEEDRQRWRDLFSQTPAAIAILRGPEHKIEWVNPDYCYLVGRPAELLLGKPVVEALPEVADQVYVDLMNAVYRTAIPFTGRESVVRLDAGDGALRDVYVNFVYLPTRSPNGAVDGIFVHVTNVTEAVLARKQIEDSERQLRTLANSIPNLAWIADAAGDIFWYNQRWYDYTGASEAQMMNAGWQKMHDPAFLPGVIKTWQESLASETPFEMTFPLRGANGLFRSFLTRVEPIRDNEGHVVRWFGTNTDVTNQIKIEQELRHANADLQQFAFAASHDLQEPLRMVTSYTQLLARRLTGPLEDETTQYMTQIIGSAKRMSALLADLLAYTETSRDPEGGRTMVNLNDVLALTLANLRGALQENNATVDADPMPSILGSQMHFIQLFQNLIGNSIKYRSEMDPRIRITVTKQSGQWEFRVRDNGIGVAPEFQERVFGVFKRLHGKEIPGTGIGLAICQRVVERHGGRLWMESQGKGFGSTFCFTLPAMGQGDFE